MMLRVHPRLVRRVISPLLEGLLARPTFTRLRELRESEWQRAAALRELQTSRLRELLVRAQTRCPYYEKLFADCGVDACAVDPFAQLRKLPLLDKDMVRRNLDAMTDHHVAGSLTRFNTGGSTGHPLVFYIDRQRVAADKAARILTHIWHGAQPGDREVYLWGSPIEVAAQDTVKRLRDRLTNELLLDAFHLTPQSMRDYLRRIDAFNPTSIFGYPSSLAALARFGESHGHKVSADQLITVFATGEVLDAADRELISRYFGATVADGYGSRDGGFIAHECEAGAMHVIDQHVLVEVVDERGNEVPVGQAGELVVTHLHAHGTIMLRYRTGDVATRTSAVCPCGRSMTRIDRIKGRQTDHLVAADGTLQHALSAIYVVRDEPTVRQFRIRQHANRDVVVEIVPESSYTQADGERIAAGVACQLGESIRVDVHVVSRIDSEASGKYRYVVSDAAADWVQGTMQELIP